MTPQQAVSFILDGGSPSTLTDAQLERALVYAAERGRRRQAPEMRELWEEVSQELRLESMVR